MQYKEIIMENLGKSYKNSGHFHFGNNHPQMLTYYQIAAVIPKMALVRHLQKIFV